MIGAIIGDIAGSRFEFHNHRSKDFELFSKDCFFTDDTVMTLAVAKAVMEAEKRCPRPATGDCDTHEALLSEYAVRCMQEIGRHYPDCGYGGRFMGWMFDDNPKPYNSFGNGSAMRVSAASWAARTLDEAIELARIVTAVTHDHPEGLKGAEATAAAIFMARRGATRAAIRAEIERNYYPLDFTIDRIRDTYSFNETCQQTVPQAIEAFLESTSFEDAICIAVSVGGDSDTLAAITGSIAEAYYGVPDDLKQKALSYLDDRLLRIFQEWEAFTDGDPCKEPYHTLTKYIGCFEAAMLNDSKDVLDIDELGNLRNEFIHEFDATIRDDASYHDIGPSTMAEKYGLSKSLETTDAQLDTLSADQVMRLIWLSTHCDCYSTGLSESFYESGGALRCLKRLKHLASQETAPEYVEFSTSGYLSASNCTYQMVFNEDGAENNGAELTVTRLEEKEIKIVYASAEAADWLRAYEALHTEHWCFRYYIQPTICDGLSWRLTEKRCGKRETVWEGENAYPPNWTWLNVLFGADNFRCDDEYNDERLDWNPAPPAIQSLELYVDLRHHYEPEEYVSREETITLTRDEGRFSYTHKDEEYMRKAEWTQPPESLYLALWAAQFCLASVGWDVKKAPPPGSAYRHFRLTAHYDDGLESSRTGIFFRDYLPEAAWKAFLHELRVLYTMRWESEMLDDDAFGYADVDGSAVYASVVLDGEKRSFYYIAAPDVYRARDRVRVPFGAENKERVGTIKAVQTYRASEYPFPLWRTKQILGKVCDEPDHD